MSYLVAVFFVAILVCLGLALYGILRGKTAAKPPSVARALAWRVGLSIALFAAILLGWKLGLIQPTGIAPGR